MKKISVTTAVGGEHPDQLGGCELVLYSTSACHLCELAEQLLNSHPASLPYEVCDISDSDELFERYGVRIPVLRRNDGAELEWPFGAAQLADFLR